jgi:hypothetical protein
VHYKSSYEATYNIKSIYHPTSLWHFIYVVHMLFVAPEALQSMAWRPLGRDDTRPPCDQLCSGSSTRCSEHRRMQTRR